MKSLSLLMRHKRRLIRRYDDRYDHKCSNLKELNSVNSIRAETEAWRNVPIPLVLENMA